MPSPINVDGTGSVGAVAVSESDPNVVWAGMGEAPIRGNVSHGDGVWRSTDAGRTWKHAGLAATQQISAIRVHPKDPEVAWVGTTENEAKAAGVKYGKGVFPWAASGRSLSLGRDEGLTKVLFDPTTRRVLGAGIVGPNAGDLIAEIALAIEMGCDAEDIGLTVHPHPTLSETVAFAAEAFEGTLTDLFIPRKS